MSTHHTVTDTRCTMPAAEHAKTMQSATSGMTRAWNPLPNTMFSKLLTACCRVKEIPVEYNKGTLSCESEYLSFT